MKKRKKKAGNAFWVFVIAFPWSLLIVGIASLLQKKPGGSK